MRKFSMHFSLVHASRVWSGWRSPYIFTLTAMPECDISCICCLCSEPRVGTAQAAEWAAEMAAMLSDAEQKKARRQAAKAEAQHEIQALRDALAAATPRERADKRLEQVLPLQHTNSI
eukprot:COSAG05_NODE_504_length_9208_cov_22.420024_7_plen_118_part_00